MSHMHEELEVGQHLDQALRSSVTGIAQLMERMHRRAAGRDRAAAAAERDRARREGQQHRDDQQLRREAMRKVQDQQVADRRAMLDERDAARQAYGPWLREGAVERGDRLEASRAWARAAGWVEQDPRARDAERILRERITDTYGVSPAEILRSVEPGRGNPTGIPAGRISLSEALDLAKEYAPHYYGPHTSESFGRIGKSPINPTQEKFVDDWQRWATNGSLPHDTLVREWARHNGHSELLDGARFSTATEQEAALERVWRDETAIREEQEYEHHKQQLVDAGLGTAAADEAAGVSVQDRPDYRPYLDPEVFANTDPRIAVQAWESAKRDTISNPSDQVAAAARENLEEQFRRRHHVSPATYLADAVHDVGVTITDQRRSADHERQAAVATGDVRAAAQEIATEQPAVEASGSEHPKEDRGVAPRKARTEQERDHRSRTWQIAEREFRSGLDPALSPAQAGQAWRDLPEKERYERYWAAYDTDEARAVSPADTPAQSATESRTSPEDRSAAPGPVTRDRVLELNEAAAQWYSDNLRPGTVGHEYLTGRLGEDAVTNGQWRLGYAPGEWTGLANHLRREASATDQEIVEAGLGRVSSRGNVIDAFRNRAMAAITDTDGSVVGFYGRDLTGEDRNPKHLNTGATPAYTKGEHVFGLHEATPGARLARAEATFDAIAITEASDGQLQGVAPLGTALTDAQADKIAGKIGADGRVWLALDSDAAGQRQVARDFWKFTERGVDVRELGFPAGADPAQMWQEQPEVMQGLMAYPDVARSAASAVMDATIAEERVGLLTGEEAARERVDLAEGELASVLRNEFDREALNLHVRDELDRLRGQEAQALQQAEHLDQREDQLRGRAAQSLDPQQREQLEGRAERFEVGEQAARGRAAQLHGQEVAAQAIPADVDAAADMPYNRAASSDLSEVSPGAARARAVSAHGFSQSTQDALDTGRAAGKQWQPKRTTGTQQQVGRSRGMRR